MGSAPALLMSAEENPHAHQSLEVSSIDHSTVNLELGKCVINLGGGELVAEGHERVSEGLSIDLSVDLERLERLDDGLIIVGATGHFASEKGDHLGEVHWSISFVEHALGFSSRDGLAVIGKSRR